MNRQEKDTNTFTSTWEEGEGERCVVIHKVALINGIAFIS